MLCFAANSILCRLALVHSEIDPGTFTTLRVFSAALMLGLVVWLERGRLPRLAQAKPFSVAAAGSSGTPFSGSAMRAPVARK